MKFWNFIGCLTQVLPSSCDKNDDRYPFNPEPDEDTLWLVSNGLPHCTDRSPLPQTAKYQVTICIVFLGKYVCLIIYEC